MPLDASGDAARNEVVDSNEGLLVEDAGLRGLEVVRQTDSPVNQRIWS